MSVERNSYYKFWRVYKQRIQNPLCFRKGTKIASIRDGGGFTIMCGEWPGAYVMEETVWEEAARNHLSRTSRLPLVLNNKLVGNNKRVATLKQPAGRISPERGEGLQRSCGMLLLSRDRLPNLAWKLPYCVYPAHSLPPSYFIPRLHNRLFVLRFYPSGPDSVRRWRSVERRWRRVCFDLLDLSLFTQGFWTPHLLPNDPKCTILVFRHIADLVFRNFTIVTINGHCAFYRILLLKCYHLVDIQGGPF